MTVLIDFQPSTGTPFQTQVTLDGTVYTVIVTWNLFGRRYYLNIYTLAGVLVSSRPMVGSPLDYDISVAPGTFTSTLVYRAATNQLEVSP
jgi:hypothetical protein